MLSDTMRKVFQYIKYLNDVFLSFISCSTLNCRPVQSTFLEAERILNRLSSMEKLSQQVYAPWLLSWLPSILFYSVRAK